MAERLLIAVLGNQNSGKSTTWYRLFSEKVRTRRDSRRLYLNSAQFVEVFLVNGSPEEREIKIRALLRETLPPIVLCSTQYRADVKETYEHFFRNGYEVIVQWLNPGHGETGAYADTLALQDYLLRKGATLQIRDGAADPMPRVRELRQFILGWAAHRDLVRTEWPT